MLFLKKRYVNVRDKDIEKAGGTGRRKKDKSEKMETNRFFYE